MTATVSPLEGLQSRGWPATRRKRREEARAWADELMRTVICGNCEEHSPSLDGPSGRAWWHHHSCKKLRVVK